MCLGLPLPSEPWYCRAAETRWALVRKPRGGLGKHQGLAYRPAETTSISAAGGAGRGRAMAALLALLRDGDERLRRPAAEAALLRLLRLVTPRTAVRRAPPRRSLLRRAAPALAPPCPVAPLPCRALPRHALPCAVPAPPRAPCPALSPMFVKPFYLCFLALQMFG